MIYVLIALIAVVSAVVGWLAHAIVSAGDNTPAAQSQIQNARAEEFARGIIFHSNQMRNEKIKRSAEVIPLVVVKH